MHLELCSSLILSCITWFKIMSLVTCTQLTIAIDCFAFLTPADSRKPQASSHVMGPCRQFISGQKVLLLSLPTDILFLSLAVLLPFLCSPLWAHAALQLTVTPGRGYFCCRLCAVITTGQKDFKYHLTDVSSRHALTWALAFAFFSWSSFSSLCLFSFCHFSLFF